MTPFQTASAHLFRTIKACLADVTADRTDLLTAAAAVIHADSRYTDANMVSSALHLGGAALLCGSPHWDYPDDEQAVRLAMRAYILAAASL